MLKKESLERKIARKVAILEEAGLPVGFKRKKKPKRVYRHGDYVRYIKSAEWNARRREYFEAHKRECRTCGSDEREIHLHHRTYDRLFEEIDADLMPLCDVCHASLHIVQKTFKITVEEGTAIWFSATNGTSTKKKIREKLREKSLADFKNAWRKRDKDSVSPALCLSDVIACITKVEKGTREDVIKDDTGIKVSAARAITTGNTRHYDKKVDAIIRKLEKA